MQTVADMRGVGVKNRENFADVLCRRPLSGGSKNLASAEGIGNRFFTVL